MINYKEKFEEVLKIVYESEDYAHLINEVRDLEELLLIEELEDILYNRTISFKNFDNIDEYKKMLKGYIYLDEGYRTFMDSLIFRLETKYDFWTDDHVIEVERIYNIVCDILGDMAAAAREYFSQKDLKKDESV